MDTKKWREKMFDAAIIGCQELLKVVEAPIFNGDEKPDPEKLKMAAQKNKVGVFEYFDILDRVDEEMAKIKEAEEAAKENKEEKKEEKPVKLSGFAERNAKKSNNGGGGF